MARPPLTTAVVSVVPPSVKVTTPSGSPSGLVTRRSKATVSPAVVAVSWLTVVLRATVRVWVPFPREVVAAYAGDQSRAPEWYANIESVQWRTTPPVAVGSRMDFEARFLGRRLAYTYEVVELEPGSRLVMRTAMKGAMTKDLARLAERLRHV